MKQSEIQEIINTNPTAVLNSNAKYQGDFIVTGFVQEQVQRYSKPTTFALTQQVFFNDKTQTVSLGTVQKKALRIITGVFSESIDAYTTYKIERFERSEKAKIARAQNIAIMNEIKPELKAALKACGVDNLQHNFGTMDTTFKIEVNLDNAEQLLKVLQAFAAQQVGA